MKNYLGLALILASMAMGCGTAGNAAGPCAPNEQIECSCGDLGSGYQVCNAEGTAYSVCECNGGMGGSASATSSGGMGGSAPVIPEYCNPGSPVVYDCADCPDVDGVVNQPAWICDKTCSDTSSQYIMQMIDVSTDSDFSIVFDGVIDKDPTCQFVCESMYGVPVADAYAFLLHGLGCARITTDGQRLLTLSDLNNPGDAAPPQMCGDPLTASTCVVIPSDAIKTKEMTLTVTAEVGASPGWVRVETTSNWSQGTCPYVCP